MKQTPNLKLSLPDPADPADIAVLNANFKVLDAAGRVKFKEVVTSAAAAEVDVSLADIDFTKYRSVDVLITAPAILDYPYKLRFTDASLCIDITANMSQFLCSHRFTTPTLMATIFSLHQDGIPSVLCSYVNSSRVGSGRFTGTLKNAGSLVLVRYDTSSSSADVPAGTKFEFWGETI